MDSIYYAFVRSATWRLVLGCQVNLPMGDYWVDGNIFMESGVSLNGRYSMVFVVFLLCIVRQKLVPGLLRDYSIEPRSRNTYVLYTIYTGFTVTWPGCRVPFSVFWALLVFLQVFWRRLPQHDGHSTGGRRCRQVRYRRRSCDGRHFGRTGEPTPTKQT